MKPSSRWRDFQDILSVAGAVASPILTFFLLRWAARRDRHFHVNWGGPVDIRTHAGLFLEVGLLAALPALLAAVIGARGKRWIGWTIGLGCLLVAALFEAAVQYDPELFAT
ncbi:hypothetical protein I6A60_06400 [Frankia sp. AgB1.9]|uniref:hypothetical protein n=1 Tax=unclassified Frankia TaxID=2632575 RepID=UPI00193196B2|nr:MULTISPECIES: hypothetical protein [unclassified Frankia]MBL7494029.1 hypothetical protein [Frankia sp. AgW1.1]MBL7547508.1 hypothetical protein [Frankia sp. AgB1.9]MBL7619019.1 hypothetical protein [Frankia sp. AgB1.8]